VAIAVAVVAVAVLAAGFVVVTAAGGDAHRPPPTPLAATPTGPTSVGPSSALAADAQSATAPASASTDPAAPRSTAADAQRTPAVRTPKKGASAWYVDGVTRALTDVKASWYYTWAAEPGKVAAPAGVEFVPMIWGADSVTPANLARAKGAGKVILGFNEPDLGSQSNLPVERALELWPQLAATGARLGSPAVSFGADTAGGWLDRFMAGARSRGYRVDFITLHWYGSDFSAAATGQLRRYIEATYNRYHLPIWLTEYALIKFSGGGSSFPSAAAQVAFVNASTQMLEGLPYVERYAWFALPTAKSGDTGLYRPGAVPTEVGLAYRAAG
jgi:hypothetical protein